MTGKLFAVHIHTHILHITYDTLTRPLSNCHLLLLGSGDEAKWNGGGGLASVAQTGPRPAEPALPR